MTHTFRASVGSAVTIILLLVAGCASGKSGGADSTSGASAAPSQQLSNAAPAPTAPSSAGPIIPKGAQWTLYCLTIPGRDHVAQANQLKADLLRTSSMK